MSREPERAGRVPELGPWLGRLVASETPGEIPLDDIRLGLLDRLFDAARRSRDATDRPNEDATVGIQEPGVWLEIFRAAADQAAGRCLAEIDRRIEAAAAVSRMPERQLARHRPSSADRTVTVNRFRSTVIPLEKAAAPDGSATETEGLRRRAAALEACWERLRRVVDEELAAGDAIASRVRAWTRPRGPLWVISSGVAIVALVLGLVLGGYLPAPGPLAALRRWWWSLPWP